MYKRYQELCGDDLLGVALLRVSEFGQGKKRIIKLEWMEINNTEINDSTYEYVSKPE